MNSAYSSIVLVSITDCLFVKLFNSLQNREGILRQHFWKRYLKIDLLSPDE